MQMSIGTDKVQLAIVGMWQEVSTKMTTLYMLRIVLLHGIYSFASGHIDGNKDWMWLGLQPIVFHICLTDCVSVQVSIGSTARASGLNIYRIAMGCLGQIALQSIFIKYQSLIAVIERRNRGASKVCIAVIGMRHQVTLALTIADL